MATTGTYQWRDPKSPSYFGNQSFGAKLSGAVQNSGGAPSDIANSQTPNQVAPASSQSSFKIPGGDSAGFNSAAFNPGDGPAPQNPQDPQAAKPKTFSQALQENPLAEPLIGQASQAIGQNLQGNQNPSMSSMFALNEYNKGEGEALRQAKESSALNGHAFTGQLGGDVGDYVTQKLIPARQNFLGQLQGQEEQQNITKQQNAFQNLSTLAGLGQQGEQNSTALAQTKELALKDLSLREKELAQSGSQFQDELSFKKYATDKGFSNDEAQRAWQATQNERQISATSVQNNLSRELQKYIADQGYDIDAKKMATQIQQFNSTQDFEKWRVTAGLDDAVAQRIWQGNRDDIQRKFEAGQQLTQNEQNVLLEKMKNDHDTSMATLNHTLNLDTLEKEQANTILNTKMAQSFTSLMTDKGYSHEEAMATTKQDYEKELLGMGYDQQTAMQASQQWFDGQQQDKQLSQAKTLAEAQLAQNSTQFSADLQQKYDFKDQDVQLAYQKLAQDASEFASTLGLDQAKFDLLKGSSEFENLAKTTATLTAMAGDNPDMLQFAAENFYKGLGNLKNPDGSPVMTADKVAQGTLNMKASSFKDPASFETWAATAKDPSGKQYTPEQIAAAKNNINAKITDDGTQTYATQVKTFKTTLGQVKSSLSPDIMKTIQDNSIEIKNIADKLDPNKIVAQKDNRHASGMMINAEEHLNKIAEDNGLDPKKVYKGLYDRSKVGGQLLEEGVRYIYSATQVGMDYANYYNMVVNGLDPEEAKKAFTDLVGNDRANSALALETKR